MTRRISDIKAPDITPYASKAETESSNLSSDIEKYKLVGLLECCRDVEPNKQDANQESLAKERLDKFKSSKAGKNIYSFGSLLIGSGVLGVLGCLYTLYSENNPKMLLLSLAVSIPTNYYFISIGRKIQKNRFTADELDDRVGTIVVLSILALFFRPLDLPGILIWIDMIFIWIDSYRYHKSWYHEYRIAVKHGIAIE